MQLGGSVLRLEKTHRESAVPSHPLTLGAESAGKGSWSQGGLGAGRGRLPQAFSTRSPGGGGLSRLVAGSVRWGPRGRVSRHGQCPCCGIEVSARTHSDAARGRPRESGADAGVPSPLPAAHTGVWALHLSGLGFPPSPGQGLLDDSDESYGLSPSKLAHVRFELCAPFPGSPAVQCGPRFEIMAPSCLLHWGNLRHLQSHNLTFSLLRVLDRRLRGLCGRGLGFSISVAQVHATLLCKNQSRITWYSYK